VGPELAGALLEGGGALQPSRQLDVVLDDLELELDDLGPGRAVDLAKDGPSAFILATEDEDSRGLGKSVEQGELDERRDDAEAD
jgi:hypothetical protein